jgi:phosphoribosyl 1,2-cyclic phosphodiesterase
MSENFIKILGTAGARIAVAKQLRSSAGTFIRYDGKNIILDPGPGTLVRCAKSKPKIDVTEIDAIILTHSHIDHSNDVNILIDAMTTGGLNRRGVLFAPDDCLNDENSVVLKYLRGFLEEIVVLKSQREYSFNGITFSTSRRHLHNVETYGIKFKMQGQVVSFMVDTRYFPELIESYKGSDVLIVNVVRSTPHKSDEIMHLCIDDVRRIISVIRPRRTIMTHFGRTMLRSKPWVLAEKLTEELNSEVIAAYDGMKIELNRSKRQ